MHRGSVLVPLVALALMLRVLLPVGPMAAPMASLGPAGADSVLAELLAGGGICHGDPDAPAKAPASVACVLCPMCLAPLPLLAGAEPRLPAPPVLAGAAPALWPPATAPPVVAFRPANPRAPPALSA
jgi:hypothetical protein